MTLKYEQSSPQKSAVTNKLKLKLNNDKKLKEEKEKRRKENLAKNLANKCLAIT